MEDQDLVGLVGSYVELGVTSGARYRGVLRRYAKRQYMLTELTIVSRTGVETKSGSNETRRFPLTKIATAKEVVRGS